MCTAGVLTSGAQITTIITQTSQNL